jgi:alkylation response protein AidB-like acyl-CoA dehydrogenase
MFVTNGGYAGVIIVLCRTGEAGGKGLTVLAVETPCKGMTAGPPIHKMGLLASNTVELTFEDCEVPEENRIGKEGEGIRIIAQALDGGRIGIAAQSTGMTAACLDEAMRYAKERRQFSKAIINHQAVQWMIAEIGMSLEASKLLVLSAASLKQMGKPFSKEASIAKCFASEELNRAAFKSLQVHGGYGYTREFTIERIYRDARVTTIYEGSNEIQRMIIARELVK